ncbi:MAG: hypothetical protein JW751_14940 [Polyangiaceae bacterium]|nr:hypothetical protein [Polyangiaceae bacterium]
MAGLAVSAAFIVGVGAVGLEATAGMNAEVAGGLAPTRSLGPTEPAVIATLAPSVSGTAYTRRFSFQLTYGPRLFLRRPTAVEDPQPTLLQQATATQSYALSRRTMWRNTAAADYGRVDYTEFAELVETDDANAAAAVSRVGVVNLAASSSVTHVFSRRYQAGSSVGWARREFVDDETSYYPTSNAFYFTIAQALELTRRDVLNLATNIGWAEYAWDTGRPGAAEMTTDELRYHSADATIGWGHRASRATSTSVEGGLTVVDAEEGDLWASPMANASAASSLGSVGEVRLGGTAAVTVTAALDPLTGRPRRAIGATLGLEGRDGPWTYRANLTSTTASTTRESEEGPTASLGAEISATEEVRRSMVWSFGVRASARRLDFGRDTGEFADEQLLGFVRIDYQRAFVSAGASRR